MGLFGSNDITGVDVGAGSVKFARIKPGRRPKLIAAGMVEIPPDAAGSSAVSADLAVLKAGRKFGKKNIVTLVPGRLLTVRFLVMPKMPPQELREAVHWEAKRHISYPLEAAQVDYLIIGERQEGMTGKYEVLLFAAERSTVAEHLVPFQEARIGVAAVDANSLALRNVLRRREMPKDANILVVDLGAGKTEINILKNGGLRFSRCLETGGIDLTRAVSGQLGIAMLEAEEVKCRTNLLASAGHDSVSTAVRGWLDGLLVEVRRSLEYYKTVFREKSVERAVLTGGGALTNGIVDLFTSSLGMPAEQDNPLAGLSCRKTLLAELGPMAPRYSAAIGLALRRTR